MQVSGNAAAALPSKFDRAAILQLLAPQHCGESHQQACCQQRPAKMQVHMLYMAVLPKDAVRQDLQVRPAHEQALPVLMALRVSTNSLTVLPPGCSGWHGP